MVAINWLCLTIFSMSEISLSDPSHWVIIMKTSLGERPMDLWEGPLSLKIMETLKLWRTNNPSYIPTMLDETTFHEEWQVTKVPLLSYFVRLWGQSFRHDMCVGEGEPMYDQIASFQEKDVHIFITILCQYKCWKYFSELT